MLHELLDQMMMADSAATYDQHLKELSDYLISTGKAEEAQKLTEAAAIRKNRFSKREAAEDLAAGKAAVAEFFRREKAGDTIPTGLIHAMLENFPLFCRKLYGSVIHEKCSSGIRQHLTGFCIENEYDLQKLMLAVLSSVFPDARTESVQDSGHHAVRKDIVIDSQSAVIELKCTHAGSTERNLSEEIAADMVHYDCDALYFYIYDKAGILDNPVSFKQTYEKKRIDRKTVHVILYTHSDI